MYSKKQIRIEIIILIIPIILENILQISAGIVSTAMIGRLSADSISGQGICLRLTDTLWCLYKGIGIGVMITAARHFGKGNRSVARRTTRNAFLSALPLALAFGIILYCRPLPFLRLLTDDTAVISKALVFMRIIVFGFPFVLIMQIVTASFQADGDTRTPMFIAMAVNIINVFAGYILIFGTSFSPALGVKGAAAALVLSQTAGALLGLFLLYNRKGLFRDTVSTPSSGSSPAEDLKQIYGTGLPASFESVFWQLSAIVLSRIILSYGSGAFAAYQLGIQAETITEMPAIGFGLAATTLTARHLGNGDRQAFKDYFRQTAFLSLCLSSATSLLLILLPGIFMGIMTDNPELIKIGTLYVFIMGFIQIPQNLSRVFNGAIRAAGYSRIPMYIAAAGLWIFRIPLSFLAAYFLHLPLYSIWLFIAADQLARFCLSILCFRYKKIGSASSLRCSGIITGEKT